MNTLFAGIFEVLDNFHAQNYRISSSALDIPQPSPVSVSVCSSVSRLMTLTSRIT